MIDKFQDLAFLEFRTPGEHTQGDIFTKSGGLIEQLSTFLIKNGDLLADNFLQRLGQVVFFHTFEDPLFSGKGDFSIRDQLAQDLADKERISPSELG